MPQTVSHPMGLASAPPKDATEKKKRRWRNHWWRRRKRLVTAGGGGVIDPPHPEAPNPPAPPLEEEDWDKETSNLSPPDYRPGLYGLDPYGPEDVVSFDLRGVSLQHTEPHFHLPGYAYQPACHHVHPVPWFRHVGCIVDGQFSDAEDDEE